MKKYEDVVEFVLMYIVIVFLLGLIMIPIYNNIVSDGEVRYCYIQYDGLESWGNGPKTYSLYGNRDWARDRLISSGLHSLVEAKEEADLIAR